jgi:polyphosphate kinase
VDRTVRQKLSLQSNKTLADWMKRNQNSSIEVLTPIYDEDLHAELKHILHLYINKNIKARIHGEEEKNRFVQKQKHQPIIHSQ